MVAGLTPGPVPSSRASTTRTRHLPRRDRRPVSRCVRDVVGPARERHDRRLSECRRTSDIGPPRPVDPVTEPDGHQDRGRTWAAIAAVVLRGPRPPSDRGPGTGRRRSRQAVEGRDQDDWSTDRRVATSRRRRCQAPAEDVTRLAGEAYFAWSTSSSVSALRARSLARPRWRPNPRRRPGGRSAAANSSARPRHGQPLAAPPSGPATSHVPGRTRTATEWSAASRSCGRRL